MELLNLDALADILADKVAERLNGQPKRHQLYDTKMLCDELKLSPDAVRLRMRRGDFGSLVNVGERKHLVTQAGLDAFIQNNTFNPNRYEHIKQRRQA